MNFALSFDDVLLKPQYSTVASRKDPDLSTWLTRSILVSNPLLPTNMDQITEIDMIKASCSLGGAAFLHRFMDYGKIVETVRTCRDLALFPVCISVGVKQKDKDLIARLAGEGCLPHVILVDIAHGHSKAMCKMVKHIKATLACDVIGGNVATAQGYEYIVECGCDAVRVGISGGSVCTTRYKTGFGCPTLQSIIDCANRRDKMLTGHKVPIIADGGISNSGDIVKALAFGADCVCVGRMLAGSSATPGRVIEKDGKTFKEYYGMSSHEAHERHKGGTDEDIDEEGISKLVPYAGNTVKLMKKALAGVRSGLSYAGAMGIAELRRDFEYYVLGAGSVHRQNNNWKG